MPISKLILYCQVPGLLSRCALQARGIEEARVPLAVAEGKLVRDASLLAGKRGVQVGESQLRARRLCPELLVVPLGEVDARSLSAELWDGLAELTDQVEPSGPDAAFAKLYGEENIELLTRRFTGSGALAGLSPKLALGCSKLEAATLALAGVTLFFRENCTLRKPSCTPPQDLTIESVHHETSNRINILLLV